MVSTYAVLNDSDVADRLLRLTDIKEQAKVPSVKIKFIQAVPAIIAGLEVFQVSASKCLVPEFQEPHEFIE